MWINKSSQNEFYLNFDNCYIKSYNGLPVFSFSGDGHEVTFIARFTYFGATGDGSNLIVDLTSMALDNTKYAGQVNLQNNIFEIDDDATRSTDGGIFYSSLGANAVPDLWIVNTGNNRFQSWATVTGGVYNVWNDASANTPLGTIIFQNDSPSISNFSAFTSPDI